MSLLMLFLLDNMGFRFGLDKSFVSGQYLFFFSSFSMFAEKFLFLLFLLFVFVVFLMEDLVSAVMRHGIMQFN